MPRNTIALVWLFGIVLAAALYATGPDQIVRLGFEALFGLQHAVQAAFTAFTVQAFDVMRALAVALFAVFVVLCGLATRRGLPAVRTLVVVGALFLALLYGPVMNQEPGDPVASGRWTGAFLLAAIGAGVMTRRLAAFRAA